MPTLPTDYLNLIREFAPHFSNLVWEHVQSLLLGAILAPGQRTVAAVLRIVGLSAERQFQTYPRGLNRAVWSSWALSRVGHWYATLVVEKSGRKPSATQKVKGIDIGMTSIGTTSSGEHYGQVSGELARRVEKQAAKFGRKQKLNACLKKKGKPPVSLTDHRAEAFARNEIGRALNALVADLSPTAPVALERLSVHDLRFKSRQMNRRLRASQLGYIKDKLRFKLDERGLRYRSVQAAYSSQQCSRCGFVSAENRKSQAEFVCQHCGFVCHADVNAARNIAERFGDAELNQLPFREVKALLEARFQRRLSPDAVHPADACICRARY